MRIAHTPDLCPVVNTLEGRKEGEPAPKKGKYVRADVMVADRVMVIIYLNSFF